MAQHEYGQHVNAPQPSSYDQYVTAPAPPSYDQYTMEDEQNRQTSTRDTAQLVDDMWAIVTSSILQRLGGWLQLHIAQLSRVKNFSKMSWIKKLNICKFSQQSGRKVRVPAGIRSSELHSTVRTEIPWIFTTHCRTAKHWTGRFTNGDTKLAWRRWIRCYRQQCPQPDPERSS